MDKIVVKYYMRKVDGKIDYEHPYDSIVETNIQGLYRVSVGDLIGYVNSDNEVVIPVAYTDFDTSATDSDRINSLKWLQYKEDTKLIRLYKGNLKGIINSRGEVVVPFEFDEIQFVSEDYVFIAVKDEKNEYSWGVYDIRNKRISVPMKYTNICFAYGEYATFITRSPKGLYGFLHYPTGNEVILASTYKKGQKLMSSDDIVLIFKNELQVFRNRTRTFCSSSITEGCSVWVLNGENPAICVIDNCYEIKESGPNVVRYINYEEPQFYDTRVIETLKIVKMPEYICLIKNAMYEGGGFDERTGEFIDEETRSRIAYGYRPSYFFQARYISGGEFTALNYAGEEVLLTDEMRQEILKAISEERFLKARNIYF